MKNFGKNTKQFKQGRQFKGFYQGTGTFYTGTYTGLVSYTQKVVLFEQYRNLLPKLGRMILT